MTNSEQEDAIQQLTKQIRLQNSYKRNFTMGIVKGFGGALGATVVFGLVLAIFSQVVQTIDYVPFINNILNSQAIEELILRFSGQS